MTRRLAAALAAGLAVTGCAGVAPEPRDGDERAAGRSHAVPILVYHDLRAPPPGDRRPSLSVAPARFAAQLDALAAAGFRGVTLAAVRRAWEGGAPLPARPVVLSFDDGYAAQATVGRRMLRRHRWPGVLNLQLARLDVPGGLAQRAVARLARAGWQVDDHSATHPDLTRVDDARLRAEVAGSRAALRRRLGIDARFFCYPYGRLDGRVRRAVLAAGFLGATTTRPGRATADDDPFALPRIVVRATTTPAQLVRVATGAAR